MSNLPPTPTATTKTDVDPAPQASSLTSAPKDSSSQMIVALTIVIGMVTLGLGAFVVGVIQPTTATTSFSIASAVVGSLATALQAPSGISAVIGAARKALS